jgi:hypothetical protein
VSYVNPATVDGACGMIAAFSGLLGSGMGALLGGGAKGGSGFNLGSLGGFTGFPSAPKTTGAKSRRVRI